VTFLALALLRLYTFGDARTIVDQMLAQENRSTRQKTLSQATLSTTNPAWNRLDVNKGFRNERPANKRLGHGTTPQVFEFSE
jgi:hypothetical protein